MKTKILKIKFESWDKFKIRSRLSLEKVLKDRKKIVQSMDTLIFDSILSFQKIMSEQKYMILATIKNRKPISIYQLAKWVERDFPNVKKDCDSLKALGFIIYKDSDDARGTKIPQLKFDYDLIEICLPEMTYSHWLGKSAA